MPTPDLLSQETVNSSSFTIERPLLGLHMNISFVLIQSYIVQQNDSDSNGGYMVSCIPK